MKRWLALVLMFTSVVFSTAGVAYLARPMGRPEVRMGLPVFSGLEPLVLAQRKGYYAAHAADIRVQRFTSLYDSKRAFAEGKIDVTTMTIFDAILLANLGVPFKIVLVVDTTQGSNAIVARAGLATVKDLRGKRVGVTAGAALHSVLLTALHQCGMREADVIIVNHPPDRLAELFLAGKLDAVSLVDPFLAKVMRETRGQIIFGSQELAEPITDVLVIRPDLDKTHPGAADALVRGYFEALDFWKSNESEALASMAESTGLTPREFQSVLKGLVIADKKENAAAFGLSKSPGSLLRNISTWDPILVENGYLQQPSKLADRLDDRFVRRAMP